MSPKCSYCGCKIIFDRGDGNKAVKNKILLIKSDGNVFSVCPQCGKEVPVTCLHYIVLEKIEIKT